MGSNKYYVYIITNRTRKYLYIGITNSLTRRLQEHFENRGEKSSWAGWRWCYYLVYFEEFDWVEKAIAREKQLKKWRREKKNWLIALQNPEWKFLNGDFNAPG